MADLDTQIAKLTLEREGRLSGKLPAMLAIWLQEARIAARRDPNSVEWCLDRLETLLEQSASTPCAEVSAVKGGGLAPWQISRVKRYIESNLAVRVTTSELADLVDLSENHFARAFKISMGCPPHAYIVTRRVKHAKALMLETEMPLSQVALASGLADQAHLSRLFRRFVGATPSSWRRQNRVPGRARFDMEVFEASFG